MQHKISVGLLRTLISYDSNIGALRWIKRPRTLFKSEREWKRWNTRYAGKAAFSANSSGYLDGMIFRKMYRAHHVAWALYYGEWPSTDLQIDHINGSRTDNRICNLRIVDRSTNCRNTRLRSNNTSGVLGVAPHGDRWRAYIRDNGRNRHIGVFDTIEDAAAARKRASAEAGYHENHGRGGVRWSEPKERKAA